MLRFVMRYFENTNLLSENNTIKHELFGGRRQKGRRVSVVVVVEGEGKRDGVVVVGAGEDFGGGAGGVWGRRDEEGRSGSRRGSR